MKSAVVAVHVLHVHGAAHVLSGTHIHILM
jgi:hypothetical protein